MPNSNRRHKASVGLFEEEALGWRSTGKMNLDLLRILSPSSFFTEEKNQKKNQKTITRKNKKLTNVSSCNRNLRLLEIDSWISRKLSPYGLCTFECCRLPYFLVSRLRSCDEALIKVSSKHEPNNRRIKKQCFLISTSIRKVPDKLQYFLGCSSHRQHAMPRKQQAF